MWRGWCLWHYHLIWITQNDFTFRMIVTTCNWCWRTFVCQWAGHRSQGTEFSSLFLKSNNQRDTHASMKLSASTLVPPFLHQRSVRLSFLSIIAARIRLLVYIMFFFKISITVQYLCFWLSLKQSRDDMQNSRTRVPSRNLLAFKSCENGGFFAPGVSQATNHLRRRVPSPFSTTKYLASTEARTIYRQYRESLI